MPAERRQEQIALGAVLASAALFAFLVPFAQKPLGELPAFVALYQAALVFNDVATAALLFAQCRFSRSRPLFVLGCGYLFTACMIAGHTLTFPGLFAPQGLLGSGMQSTAWIYMFWHGLFPLFVIGYAFAGKRPVGRRDALLGLSLAVAGAAALVGLATRGEALLPELMSGHRYQPGYRLVVGAVWLASIAAAACVWRKRPRTVLDLWVLVVMCVWVFEIGLAAVFNAGRFDLGFYAGRVYGLVAASILFYVMVFETSVLHARLAAAAEERAKRAEAEAANRAKDQFIAMLGHELRSPLAPIASSLSVMRLRDGAAFAAERGVIERQVANLSRLVEELLETARLARGGVRLELARCQVAEIVARAVEMVMPLVEERRHRLELDVPGGLELRADAARLAQALCNLLGNAARYTAPGGLLRVQAARDRDEIVVRVTDNGSGFDASLGERLFEPFSQGPQGQAAGGLGLGLAIVKRLAELHGGSVQARSAGSGRGAEFVLRLPAPAAEAAPELGFAAPRAT